MGAHNIEFKMVGTPSFIAVKKKFDDLRKENRDYNGHREGYSGDFQTVREVKDHTHKTFDSYNEAHNYCLDTAQKWDFVVAVRYKFIDAKSFKYSAKVEKLDKKCQELTQKLRDLQNQPVKLAKFVTCEGCRSKVASQHLRGTKCPVCGEGDFRPLGLQRKIAKLNDKIKLAQTAFESQKKTEKAKGMKKFGKVGTLVAGWGAS
jgi:hypothetical protein